MSLYIEDINKSLDSQRIVDLELRVDELEAALRALPQAQGHLSDIFCLSFHRKECTCGHRRIARALRVEPEPDL